MLHHKDPELAGSVEQELVKDFELGMHLANIFWRPAGASYDSTITYADLKAITRLSELESQVVPQIGSNTAFVFWQVDDIPVKWIQEQKEAGGVGFLRKCVRVLFRVAEALHTTLSISFFACLFTSAHCRSPCLSLTIILVVSINPSGASDWVYVFSDLA